MKISVVYATEQDVFAKNIDIKAPASLRQAIEQSGILRDCPTLNLSEQRVGIFGKLAKLDTLLHDLDRIEIYRPLKIDPKEARRLRALK